MKTLVLTLIVIGVILFFFLDLAARELLRKLQEIKRQAEREDALTESLRLDFTWESKTLKRAVVKDPKARILCVDDEAVVLDSFRKILVLDGYSVDTVETGQEALGLIQMHDYDFVFTDLKMPHMSGTDVAKSVKHLRPDIDVVIITGYASVESAVECMKYGAMDYVEKPFTEDELSIFARRALIKRQDRIQKQLKPRVHVIGSDAGEEGLKSEFSIPGGVLISDGHCWASLAEDGTAGIGIDDFAKKLLGRVDAIEFPTIGMNVKAGQPLFTVHQDHRKAQFLSPISGKVVRINEELAENGARLEDTPYGINWICAVEGANLDTEMPGLKIGKSAIAFFQEEIERFQTFVQRPGDQGPSDPASLCIGAIEKMEDEQWEAAVKAFFDR